MREIKLRVLNKKTNEITDQIVSINLQHNEVCTWREIYGVDDSYIQYEVLYGSKDEFELMQFTGLQDKNGTDIYEGDIVEIIEDYGYSNIETPIKFITCVSIDSYHLNLLDRSPIKSEIIGNIHKNHELLENKQ